MASDNSELADLIVNAHLRRIQAAVNQEGRPNTAGLRELNRLLRAAADDVDDICDMGYYDAEPSRHEVPASRPALGPEGYPPPPSYKSPARPQPTDVKPKFIGNADEIFRVEPTGEYSSSVSQYDSRPLLERSSCDTSYFKRSPAPPPEVPAEQVRARPLKRSRAPSPEVSDKRVCTRSLKRSNAPSPEPGDKQVRATLHADSATAQPRVAGPRRLSRAVDSDDELRFLERAPRVRAPSTDSDVVPMSQAPLSEYGGWDYGGWGSLRSTAGAAGHGATLDIDWDTDELRKVLGLRLKRYQEERDAMKQKAKRQAREEHREEVQKQLRIFYRQGFEDGRRHGFAAGVSAARAADAADGSQPPLAPAVFSVAPRSPAPSSPAPSSPPAYQPPLGAVPGRPPLPRRTESSVAATFKRQSANEEEDSNVSPSSSLMRSPSHPPPMVRTAASHALLLYSLAALVIIPIIFVLLAKQMVEAEEVARVQGLHEDVE